VSYPYDADHGAVEGPIEPYDWPYECQWFAYCTNEATGTTPHPILGDVPTCDRCHRFATDSTERADSALTDARVYLSELADQQDIEDDAGTLADNIRDAHTLASDLLTTDVEDLEDAIRELIAVLSDSCTDAQYIYDRL
jgi:hypothetical protein